MIRDARPWYALDLPKVVVAALFVMVVVALMGALYLRRQVAAIPEIGRATPIEELRAAWAEAEAEYGPRKSKPVPFTMPQPRPEIRP